ncbi:MAG: type 4a pilus biogenesis protein PilO [Mariprofundaceae bacterium]|nr:type 4a pilus biogenesis protein PilO [Mariprofundaceae bacterium]
MNNFITSFSALLPYPMWQKFMMLAVIVVAILGLYIFLSWVPLNEDIVRAESDLERITKQVSENQLKAQDLDRKKKEFEGLERSLKVALSMLPTKSEIPKLLKNITWAGKQSGLVFKKFKPGREKNKKQNFYADMPIDIEVYGSFKDSIAFLSKIGELPRIVDMQRLSLKRASKEDKNMEMTGRAMTYRFIESGDANK